MNNIIYDTDFGNIHIKRNSRAKNIIYRVKEGELHATIPTYATITVLKKSIDDNRVKIGEMINRNPVKKKPLNLSIKTHTLSIELKTDRVDNVMYQMKGECLHLIFPENTDFEDKHTQQIVEKGVSYFLKREAKKYLPGRLKMLADKVNAKYNSVSITYGKKRLGKCDSKRNIALSYHLMYLPEHLIDYIILHELAHLFEMNHGPAFHNMVNKFTNNQENVLERELKRFVFPF